MSSETMVFGATLRRSEKWRVYRIRTANSEYELEVQAARANGERRCTVLTRVAPKDRAGETFEDTNPQADRESLYDLSPMDWIGKRLSVGTATTSEVQAVDFVKLATERSNTRTYAPSPERTQPAQHWAPFPLGYVEMTEAAAAVLNAVCHRHDLRTATEDDPLLRQRLRMALAQCQLMLDAIERQFNNPRG